MAFITKPDLGGTLHIEIRDLIARFSDAIIQEKCDVAETEIETWLGAKYNIRPELEKQGDARNKLLFQTAVDMAIYHLYVLAGTAIPNIRVKRYEDAIERLKYLAKGQITLAGVPAAPTEGDGAPLVGNILWGSNPKRDNYW